MKRREFIKVSTLLGAGATVSPAFLLGGCAAKPLPGTGTVGAYANLPLQQGNELQ